MAEELSKKVKNLLKEKKDDDNDNNDNNDDNHNHNNHNHHNHHNNNNDDDEWNILLVDGFLLYVDQDVINELDTKLFVNASYDTLKTRRENRSVYVTIEGKCVKIFNHVFYMFFICFLYAFICFLHVFYMFFLDVYFNIGFFLLLFYF